jgi:hypothetical protein
MGSISTFKFFLRFQSLRPFAGQAIGRLVFYARPYCTNQNHIFMKTALKLAIAIALITIGTRLSAQTWTPLTTDVTGDGSDPSLLDGTDFQYRYDKNSDSLYFKVGVNGFTTTTQQAVGVNIMINIPSGGSTFNFWGNDNKAAYHKLLTVWVTGTPPSSYSGTIGIADAAGVGSSNYTSLSSNNIDIDVATASNEIILGLKRSDFITDTEMGGSQIVVTAAAAVGSNTFWNDDIATGTGAMDIDRSTTTGIDENTAANTIGIRTFPNPAKNQLTLTYTLTHETTVAIRLLNVLGKEALVKKEGSQPAGMHLAELNLTSLQAGMYYVEVQYGNEVAVSQLLIE